MWRWTVNQLAETREPRGFDWSDPPRTIESLVMALRAELKGTPNRRFQEIGLDHVLNGKAPRTAFLVERFQDLVTQHGGDVTIYHQAAFSIFAASDDPMYKEVGSHTDEYMDLLLKEREALGKLVSSPRTTFKLILWPVRKYDAKYLSIRFSNLLSWLREVEFDSTIDVRCAPYPAPMNRHVVVGDFVLEGYKLNATSGYEMSVVRYQPTKVENAAREFETNWQRLAHGKSHAIEQIEKMRAEFCGGGV